MSARRIIAPFIALLGLLLAGRALFPTPWTNRAPQSRVHPDQADNATPASTQHPASFPEWESLTFKRLTPDSAIAELEAALNDDALWADVALSSAARHALRKHALARLTYILNARDEDRLALAHAEQAVRADPPEGIDPGSIARHQRWPEVWIDAPIDAANIRIRRLDLSSKDAFFAATTPAMSRSPLSADFGPSRSDVPLYEVIIPMKPLASPDGSERVPAFLAIAYELVDGQARWRPRRMSVYTAEHPDGRPIIAPPL